ncbi:MAG: UDP-N-acetylglucosamine--N-acetylmuramyl-(pentapeptide) pyrophosphoryl-undecaprenol N-acetylglucosamine transferase [Patescibacteria group bacterium]
MKIVLSGGGTGGSVAPLLAIYQEMAKVENTEFLFIGGNNSIEKDLAEENNIRFQSITSGKFRRYFDPRNFLSPFSVILGFFQAVNLLRKWKPDIILSAGSFVAVPVVWAAWFLKIPAIIHQQDLIKGLANKLMTPFATKITVTFAESLADFPRGKTIVCGNPIRGSVLAGNRETAMHLFSLSDKVPVVLILGGGTGALTLNKVVTDSLARLLEFCQIIHIAGKGKNIFQDKNLKDLYRPDSVEEMLGKKETVQYKSSNLDRYHAHEFLNMDELKHAFNVADIVVTRAGISTLSELAVLGKPVIIVPLAGSHQEKNADYFASRNAALTLNQKILNPELFTNFIYDLLHSKSKREELKKNISIIMDKNASKTISEEIISIIKRNGSK